MDSYLLQVEKRDINYLSVIIGAYDGMAIVRTVDPYKAVIELIVAPGCSPVIKELIDSLKGSERINLQLYNES
ncbi:MAG: DUF4911 domain-containing protein [Deltaproteobacteria bacterium]|nr:DUF4911 domain-containing protein [Deltaproteobacteria bacterium]